jgi:hypothetical protein
MRNFSNRRIPGFPSKASLPCYSKMSVRESSDFIDAHPPVTEFDVTFDQNYMVGSINWYYYFQVCHDLSDETKQPT